MSDTPQTEAAPEAPATEAKEDGVEKQENGKAKRKPAKAKAKTKVAAKAKTKVAAKGENKPKRPRKSHKTPKPRTVRAGGNGINLTPERASDDETKVLKAIGKLSKNEPAIIPAVSAEAFPGKKSTGDADFEHKGVAGRQKEREKPLAGYRRVLNALRRPIAKGLVKRERKQEKDKETGKPKGHPFTTLALTANGCEFVDALK